MWWIRGRTAPSATCHGSCPPAESGALPLLVVQGVVMSELAAAADIVLPGAAWVEKDAIYTNDQGKVQGASRAIAPPGEAMEDWQILATLGRLLGLSLPYQTASDVREGDRERAARGVRRCRQGARSRGRFRRATGCRHPTHRNAGSGTSCIRISRP